MTTAELKDVAYYVILFAGFLGAAAGGYKAQGLRRNGNGQDPGRGVKLDKPKTVEEMLVTHGELSRHCAGVQARCNELMTTRLEGKITDLAGSLKGWQQVVDHKLNRDHERFDKLERRIDDLPRAINGGKT